MSSLLEGLTIGISISNSPDLAELGLAEAHLEDAMVQVSRHLLAAGARLAFGGDLRSGGFTSILFEFVAMHQRSATAGASLRVVNVLAWPVHVSMTRKDLIANVEALEPIGEVMFLGPKGTRMKKELAVAERRRRPTPTMWAEGLTAMRKRLTRMCDARVLLGGRTTGFQGVMPGVAEEAWLSIQAEKPTYLVGGFGGCVRDLLATMGNKSLEPVSRQVDWKEKRLFESLRHHDLHDGLKPGEAQRLAASRHVDEIVTLLLRGLLRRARTAKREGQ